MKRLIVVAIALLTFGCSGYNINVQGVDVSWFKERDWQKVALGVVLSVATHEAAHYYLAKEKGLHPYFENGVIWYDEHDPWVARAGFLSQLAIGTALNIIPATRGSDFAIGWNSVCSFQLVTYHFRNEVGDFDETGLDEWAAMTGVSLFNTVWTLERTKQKSSSVNP